MRWASIQLLFSTLSRMKEQVQCERCWKRIEKRGNRKYCLQCRKAVDDEFAKAYSQKKSQQRKEAK